MCYHVTEVLSVLTDSPYFSAELYCRDKQRCILGKGSDSKSSTFVIKYMISFLLILEGAGIIIHTHQEVRQHRCGDILTDKGSLEHEKEQFTGNFSQTGVYRQHLIRAYPMFSHHILHLGIFSFI